MRPADPTWWLGSTTPATSGEFLSLSSQGWDAFWKRKKIGRHIRTAINNDNSTPCLSSSELTDFSLYDQEIPDSVVLRARPCGSFENDMTPEYNLLDTSFKMALEHDQDIYDVECKVTFEITY